MDDAEFAEAKASQDEREAMEKEARTFLSGMLGDIGEETVQQELDVRCEKIEKAIADAAAIVPKTEKL